MVEWLKRCFAHRVTRWLMLLLITGLGLALRVNVAVNGPVEYDEKTYMEAAMAYARDIRSGDLSAVIHSQLNYEHPAFNKIIYSTVFILAPMNDSHLPRGTRITKQPDAKASRVLALRLISAAFGTLAVFCLAFLNPLAGIFLAVDTFAIKYTSVIYLEALPLFLSTLSVVLFLKFLKKTNDLQTLGKKDCLWAGLSAAALGLAVASKYMYGVAGLAIALYLIVRAYQKKRPAIMAGLAAWALLAGLVFFLADPVLWPDPIGQFRKSLNFSVNYSEGDINVLMSDYPFWQPLKWLSLSLPEQPIRDVIPFYYKNGNFPIQFDTFIAIFDIFGLYRLFKENPVFFLWLVVGLAFLLVWKTKWPQYILIILPPLCLSASLGLEGMLRLIGRWIRRWGRKTPTEEGNPSSASLCLSLRPPWKSGLNKFEDAE